MDVGVGGRALRAFLRDEDSPYAAAGAAFVAEFMGRVIQFLTDSKGR